MKYCLSMLLLVAGLSGCGSNAVEQMGGGYVPPPWEALSTFHEFTVLRVAYPREEQNWSEVKKALASSEFGSGLSTFEQSPLPAEYSNKQADKETVVKAFRASIDAAKAGSESEMKTRLDEAFKALPSLQTP